jgi:hypothetical protein
MYGESYYTSFYSSESGEQRVVVSEANLISHPLDDRFISESIARQNYVDTELNKIRADMADTTWDEIVDRPFGDFSVKGEIYYSSSSQSFYSGKAEIYYTNFTNGKQYCFEINGYMEKLTYRDYWSDDYTVGHVRDFFGGTKISVTNFFESEGGSGIVVKFKDYEGQSYKYAPIYIYQEAFETRPIDEKYLPATVVKTADLTWDKIENKPFSSEFEQGEEVANAVDLYIWTDYGDPYVQSTSFSGNWFP